MDATTVRSESAAGMEIELGILPHLLGYHLRRAQVAMFQSFAAAMEPFGISPGQLGVLVIISENPGLNQTRLAAALGIDRSTMVGVLDGLEKRGLVRRAPSPTDRRSHALGLTEAGGRLLAELRPSLEAHERHIARDLTAAERETLIRLLSRVRGG